MYDADTSEANICENLLTNVFDKSLKVHDRIFNETILNLEYVYFSVAREKIIRCLIIEDNRTSV